MKLINLIGKPRRYIPAPSGPYHVGCTDVLTSYDANGVVFRLFYPSVKVKDPQKPVWLPHKGYLKGYAMYFKMWPPFFCKSFPKFVGEVNIPASWNSPLLKDGDGKFPVLVFSHGLGGCRTSYTTLCLELASYGYVIAAMEHRDFSACMSFFYEKTSSTEEENDILRETEGEETKESSKETLDEIFTRRWMLFRKVKEDKHEYNIRNKQVHYRAKECSAALDWLQKLNGGHPVTNSLDPSFPWDDFRGMLDTSRACVGGHSFGGATVISTLSLDKRFKAGLCLDTWMFPLREETSSFSSVTQPVLFINMEKFQTRDNLKIMKKMESWHSHRKIVTLKGTVHLNQSDLPFVCDRTVRLIFGAHSRLDRFQAMDITTRLSMVFLAKHLGLPVNVHHEVFLQSKKGVMQEGICIS